MTSYAQESSGSEYILVRTISDIIRSYRERFGKLIPSSREDGNTNIYEASRRNERRLGIINIREGSIWPPDFMSEQILEEGLATPILPSHNLGDNLNATMEDWDL